MRYTTLDLIEDLRIHLGSNHSDFLAKLFPNRIKRFSNNSLSILWGKERSYINNVIYKVSRDEPDFKFPDKSIRQLITNLKLNIKTIKDRELFNLIQEYNSGLRNAINFIEKLRIEIALNTGIIEMQYKELSLLLMGNEIYFKEIRRKILNSKRFNYNPDFKFSIERLNDFIITLKKIQDKTNCCIQFINKYIKNNPTLPLYTHQQYTIKNPHFFHNIDSPQKGYWFGFLGADGSIPNRNYNSYIIRIELAKKDKNQLVDFSKIIGLEIDRIKERKRLIIFENGITSFYDITYISFACKPMVLDLIKNGYLDMKINERKIPYTITSLIKKAKEKSTSRGKKWYFTMEGRISLSWLLGIYDGDGNYQGGRTATIYSSSKSFLEHIKMCFGIINRIRIIKEYEVEDIDKIMEKKMYGLTLGADFFKVMMYSYKNSMKRKRMRLIKDL